MYRAIASVAAIAWIGCAAPVQAQTAPVATPAAKPLSKTAALEQRVAELEGEVARQTVIADNARREMEALRADAKLKDELLALGRDRNAQLYAIAEEIADKFVRSRSIDPFFQGRRVKMENLRQDYEDRLRAARIHETTLPPSVQARMEAEIGNGRAPSAETPPQN
jgi:hypothetical protein